MFAWAGRSVNRRWLECGPEPLLCFDWLSHRPTVCSFVRLFLEHQLLYATTTSTTITTTVDAAVVIWRRSNCRASWRSNATLTSAFASDNFGWTVTDAPCLLPDSYQRAHITNACTRFCLSRHTVRTGRTASSVERNSRRRASGRPAIQLTGRWAFFATSSANISAAYSRPTAVASASVAVTFTNKQ